MRAELQNKIIKMFIHPRKQFSSVFAVAVFESVLPALGIVVLLVLIYRIAW